MKNKSATQDVLEYLMKHKKKGLTQLECTEKFGNTRLSAIIYNLRNRGLEIDCVDEPHVTRYGQKTSVGRYFYIGERTFAEYMTEWMSLKD